MAKSCCGIIKPANSTRNQPAADFGRMIAVIVVFCFAFFYSSVMHGKLKLAYSIVIPPIQDCKCAKGTAAKLKEAIHNTSMRDTKTKSL